MTVVPPATAPVSPSIIAGLLLTALPHQRAFGLPCYSVSQVLDASEPGSSAAYEVKARLEALLPTLRLPRGRPCKPAPAPAPTTVTADLLQFVYDHPGCVSGGEARRNYSDAFRLFILDQLQEHREVDLQALADAAQVPLGTLKDWLRGGNRGLQPAPRSKRPPPEQRSSQVQTVLAEYKRWEGNFTSFCDHVQFHHRLPFGSTLIGSILRSHGVRTPKTRQGRSRG